jgi:hypothetical protein
MKGLYFLAAGREARPQGAEAGFIKGAPRWHGGDPCIVGQPTCVGATHWVAL